MIKIDENGLQIDELTDILAELITGYREIYGADLQLSQDTPDGQRLFIASEIRELEGLLAAIPKENVIERTSLEARLENAKNVLDTLPQTGEGPKARLTFRGKPVFLTGLDMRLVGRQATISLSYIDAYRSENNLTVEI